jgi:hypothetical protein
MVAFQMINAREPPLTDIAAKMLVCRLHGGPSGRRRGDIRGNRETSSLGREKEAYLYYFRVLR